MSKTRMIVNDNQVLVDVDLIFEQIGQAKGDWKKVKEAYEALKNSIPDNLSE